MDTREQIQTAFQSGGEEARLQVLKGLSGTGERDLQTIYLAMGDESWRVRKEAAERFLSLPRAGELAGEIIELLHSEENAGLRNTAVEILISLGRQAIPHLLDEVTCNDHDVRKFILDILGEIGDSAAVPALVWALRDPDGNVRAAGAENLGKLRSPEAVPALLDALDDTDLLFRFTLLESLGQIGVMAPIDRLLRFEGEQLLRKALFDCLGRIGGADALPTLVSGLNDGMRNVREAAAIALSRVGDSFPAETAMSLNRVAGTPVAAAVSELLTSSRPEVRRAAVRLLGWLGDGRFAGELLHLFDLEELREEAAAALISLGKSAACALTSLWPEADGRSRAYLAYVFGEAECEGSDRLLFEGLAGDDPELRVLAAHALGKLGVAAAVPRLMEALGDAVEEVREAAMQALSVLSRRHRRQTLEILMPRLEHPQAEQRMYAVMVLAGLGGEEVDRRLALAMKDESSLVRRAAVRAFDGRFGGDRFTALVLALTDEDSEVRRLAAEILGATGDPQALPPLELALEDEDLWVRASAVRALGRLGVEKAAGRILSALGDPVGLVVIAALETLAGADLEKFSGSLVSALDHPDQEVVSASLQLLAAGGGSAWIEPVRERLLNHPHWEVRTTFARVLAEQFGAACRPWLEARLLVEGEDLVRQQIQDLLVFLPMERD